MEIRVHIPRPLLTLTIVTVGILWYSGIITVHLPSKDVQADATGGLPAGATIASAVQDLDRQRVTQAVLEKQEEIYKYNIQILEEQALATRDPEDIKKLNEQRAILLNVIKQRDQSEKLLVLSLQQMWDAQGTVYSLHSPAGDTVFDWPVAPALGISAHFEDSGYLARFGFPHHAVDIPTSQGTPIAAPAPGTVLKVALNGLGYSYIVLEHEDGLQTIYGHISDAAVEEGDIVTIGQMIGHSGGQPGTLGAGLATTGPHLHFAVRKDGVLVDPLKYLPSVR